MADDHYFMDHNCYGFRQLFLRGEYQMARIHLKAIMVELPEMTSLFMVDPLSVYAFSEIGNIVVKRGL